MTENRGPAPTEPSASDRRAQEFPAKGRQSFASVRRDLSESELGSAGVPKMLLDDIDRLEREVSELRTFRDRYYEKSEDCAVLKEKRIKSLAMEVIHVTCLSSGSIAIAYAPNIWSQQPIAGICLGVGLILVGGALVAKWMQR